MITEYTDISEVKQADFRTTPNTGYIYIIKNEHYVKIGQTTNPAKRLKQLSDSNSGGSRIEKICICGPMYIHNTMEKLMHSIFHQDRVEGEWFAIDYDKAKQVLINYTDSVEFHKCNIVRKQMTIG